MALVLPRHRKNELMSFHAGLRYIKARSWVMTHHNIKSQKDFSDILGVDYSMNTRYPKMEHFTNSVLVRLAKLEEYGINWRWFSDENAEMLLPGWEEDQAAADTEVQKEILQALQRQGELIEDIFQLMTKLLEEKTPE